MSPEPVHKLQRCLSACAHTTQPLSGAAGKMRNHPQLSRYDRAAALFPVSQTQMTLPILNGRNGRRSEPNLGNSFEGVFLAFGRSCCCCCFPAFLTVSDSLLRPLVMNVNPCVSMATPVFCMCSSTYLKCTATGVRGACASQE